MLKWENVSRKKCVNRRPKKEKRKFTTRLLNERRNAS